MKNLFLTLVLFCAAFIANAQTATRGVAEQSAAKPQPSYEITANLKNAKDTVAYLTYYQFGNKITAATAHNVKNGKIVFKGKGKLGKGIYSLNGQDKKSIIDFFIDDSTQKLELKSDNTENYLLGVEALNSTLENDFFTYIKYLIQQNKQLQSELAKGKGLPKKDSIALTRPKFKAALKEISAYEENFINQNKGTYIAEVINLKIERGLHDAPESDSLIARKYYRDHYWDNVKFDDVAICRNQFFGSKVNNYLDNLTAPHIDSVTVAIDKLINKTKVSPALTKLLIDHLIAKYEWSAMGFDRVVIYIADTYFKTGKAKAFYKDQSDYDRVLRRADKIRPIQIGKVAPDLSMIRTTDRDKIAKMGFENVKTNDQLTKAFFSNEKQINDLFLKMNSIQAEYLIAVFWDVDCSHCKVDVPKLLDLYHELQKEGKDVKVFSVYIYQEVEKYMKYLSEHPNMDWINVYDGVYYNNVVDKYEVHTTPVIYILDKNKVIRAKKVPVDKVKTILKELGMK